MSLVTCPFTKSEGAKNRALPFFNQFICLSEKRKLWDHASIVHFTHLHQQHSFSGLNEKE